MQTLQSASTSSAGVVSAFAKILLSIARADVIVRPVELACAATVLSDRFSISAEQACEQIMEALGRMESERTLGDCLRSLQAHDTAFTLVSHLRSDISQIALSDAQLHETEVILMEGLDNMITSMMDRAA